jgi:hypothetical protein
MMNVFLADIPNTLPMNPSDWKGVILSACGV